MADIFIYRKRLITSDDVEFICNIIAERPNIGRCALSREVCTAWDWVQPNGHLKDIVRRGLMLKLEREGHLTLPPRISTPVNSLAKRKPPEKIPVAQDPISGTVKLLSPVRLIQVRKSAEEKVFTSLVHQFHYLEYVHPVGEHLKYIAYSGDTPLVCLAFSSAPYQIGPRDTFLGWDKKAMDSNRHLLAYNTRFLAISESPKRD